MSGLQTPVLLYRNETANGPPEPEVLVLSQDSPTGPTQTRIVTRPRPGLTPDVEWTQGPNDDSPVQPRCA